MLNRLTHACALSAFVALAGCAKTTDMPSGGSESHFLMACEETRECGPDLECHDNVCTRECESDAVCEALSAEASCLALIGDSERFCGVEVETDGGVPDGFVPDDAGAPMPAVLGSSEPLHGPIQVAFIAGVDSAEQIWLRGEVDGLRQLSVWPVDPARAESCGQPRFTGGYPSGEGRFANLTFDPTGRFLVFSESLECGAKPRERVIAHELATGQSRALTYLTARPQVLADKHALVVIVRDQDEVALYDFEAGGPTLQPVVIPEGNTIDGGWTQLISLGDSSLLVAPGLPTLQRTDGDFSLSVLDPLVPDHTFGRLSADPLGTRVCVLAGGSDTASALGVMLTPDDTWIVGPLVEQSSIGNRCAISASGRYLMFGDAAFEMVDDMLVPPAALLSGNSVYGAYGEAFYATNPAGEVVRLDLAAGIEETIIALEDLDWLCGDALSDSALTELIMPNDERPLAIVKRHCGCTDCDSSGSLALRLDRHTHEVVDTQTGEHDAYSVVWPVAGGALVFSSQSVAGEDPSSPQYVDVGERGETAAADGLDGEPLLHAPAVPRRRPIANAAPAHCELIGIADLLLAGQVAEDCGYVPVGENREEAWACAGSAYDNGLPFRLIWQTQGTDSRLESGLVGRVTAAGYELYDLQYDSLGWAGVGTAQYTICAEHSRQPCTETSGECPSCDTVGMECGCTPHDQSQNGVELRCDIGP
jgi:hypothetical protein